MYKDSSQSPQKRDIEETLPPVEPTVVLEGPCLTATRQDLTKIPSFSGKKYLGQSVVTFTKSVDFSLNKLR